MRSSVALLEQLFFDLVFVFAVGQFAHHLHDEFFWRGATESGSEVAPWPANLIWLHLAGPYPV
ncbi:low temperature requirement protein A [Streptomyces nigra]|uniref:low temperature requirement protein A n=1 Tax=Streptomyces nigra TaxID=1827580 RepID=UPI0037D566F3